MGQLAKFNTENEDLRQSQWGCCPFCTLDFDIIGHLETFKADMDFIIKAMHWEVSNIRGHSQITLAH